jgi:hypothetical protein
MQYFMDSLTFFADLHTVPSHVRVDRRAQIELLAWILKTVSYTLDGATEAHGSPVLIIYNHGARYRTLLLSIFRIEWFILSQPARSAYFLSVVPRDDHDDYLRLLQEIESTSVSLLSQLFSLGVLTWRQTKGEIGRELFLDIIKEVPNFVTDGFHTIVYMLVQLCQVMPDIPISAPLCYSVVDHLWFVNYISANLGEAAGVLKAQFVSEFKIIVTEKRIMDFLQKDGKSELPALVKDMIDQINGIQETIRQTKWDKATGKWLPVLFR